MSRKVAQWAMWTHKRQETALWIQGTVQENPWRRESMAALPALWMKEAEPGIAGGAERAEIKL